MIIGYSFGALLGLELASKLESNGTKVSLLAIDGSPQFCHRTSNFAFSDQTEENIRLTVFATCIRLHFPEDHQQITKKVLGFSTWDEQVKSFAEYVMARSKYSYDYGAKMLTSVFKRVKILLECDKHSFPSLSMTPITLIRCKESFSGALDDDYGLSKYSNKKVNVNVIDGNHATMLGNSELVSLINGLF